jgi:hypothetical protein
MEAWNLSKYCAADAYVGLFCFECINELYLALHVFGGYVQKRHQEASFSLNTPTPSEIRGLLHVEASIFEWITGWVHSRPMKKYAPDGSIPEESERTLFDAAVEAKAVAHELMGE